MPTLGDHTFTVTATDNTGNTTSRSVVFTVNVTPGSIQDDVQYFLSTGAIAQNQGAPLLTKLKAAAAYRAAGDCKDASATYQAFINDVKAQIGKKITAAAAATLIADAQYLMTHCP